MSIVLIVIAVSVVVAGVATLMRPGEIGDNRHADVVARVVFALAVMLVFVAIGSLLAESPNHDDSYTYDLPAE